MEEVQKAKLSAQEHIELASTKDVDITERANELEKQVTVRDVLKHHPRLAWWIFFWAMAAMGWGFDVQVNGAMISVPAFRRDFG
jgi:hypothetical protein